MRYLMNGLALVSLVGTLASPVMAQPRGRGGQAPQVGQGGLPAGSYQASCRNEQVSGGYMTAECRAADGRWAFSRLPYTQCRSDIGTNQIGILTCGPITADSGRYVDSGGDNRGGDNRGGDNRGGDRRDERRGDNNGAAFGAGAAGLIAGALLGGALAGQNGAVAPPPPPPPAYGDPRYGDPRYDWRYQEGGYGYGRRRGEWVPIEQRADWLNRQIDRLQRDGRIDYRDARDYRRQLDRIVDRERSMERVGRFGPRQRNELDRRFNDLVEEIRHDARED
jgi:hypothetical protein